MSKLTAMKTLALLVVAGLPAGLVGCSKVKTEFIEPMEQAHNVDRWKHTEALQADLALQFGDGPVMDMKLMFETNGAKARLELGDGTLVVFDGKDAWQSPPMASFPAPGARFHVLTWPWFMASPMKMQDDGVHMAWMGMLPLQGKPHPAARMTFDPWEGDTPDDWYIMYADPDTGLLKAQSYIVTYGKSYEKASETPHAILYDGYRLIDGVRLATKWTFYHWSEEKGVYGEPIIKATLSNVRFVKPNPTAFRVPADAVRKDVTKT